MHPPDRAVFRLPFSAVAFPVLLFIITTPLATTLPILHLLFVLPVLALVYVLWTRTVADAHTLKVYTLLGRRTIAWADLDGFEFRGPRWAIAVTLDGKRVRLPMIRPRDLPALAAVSGGRLSLGAPPPVEDSEQLEETLQPVEPVDSALPHGPDLDEPVDEATATPALEVEMAAFTPEPELTSESGSADVQTPAVGKQE